MGHSFAILWLLSVELLPDGEEPFTFATLSICSKMHGNTGDRTFQAIVRYPNDELIPCSIKLHLISCLEFEQSTYDLGKL